ncbi:MAG: DUF378 domain-containing protein [Planctomycetes bacterium]|nr:DUF378 domain-containing protein [Planctomycetota bacterium]
MATEKPVRFLNGFCITLLLIAGLNWGLVGLLRWNLIESLFLPGVARVIYGLMGLAFLYEIGLRYQHTADWVCTQQHVTQQVTRHA